MSFLSLHLWALQSPQRGSTLARGQSRAANYGSCLVDPGIVPRDQQVRRGITKLAEMVDFDEKKEAFI